MNWETISLAVFIGMVAYHVFSGVVAGIFEWWDKEIEEEA